MLHVENCILHSKFNQICPTIASFLKNLYSFTKYSELTGKMDFCSFLSVGIFRRFSSKNRRMTFIAEGQTCQKVISVVFDDCK